MLFALVLSALVGLLAAQNQEAGRWNGARAAAGQCSRELGKVTCSRKFAAVRGVCPAAHNYAGARFFAWSRDVEFIRGESVDVESRVLAGGFSAGFPGVPSAFIIGASKTNEIDWATNGNTDNNLNFTSSVEVTQSIEKAVAAGAFGFFRIVEIDPVTNTTVSSFNLRNLDCTCPLVDNLGDGGLLQRRKIRCVPRGQTPSTAELVFVIRVISAQDPVEGEIGAEMDGVVVGSVPIEATPNRLKLVFAINVRRPLAAPENHLALIGLVAGRRRTLEVEREISGYRRLAPEDSEAIADDIEFAIATQVGVAGQVRRDVQVEFDNSADEQQSTVLGKYVTGNARVEINREFESSDTRIQMRARYRSQGEAGYKWFAVHFPANETKIVLDPLMGGALDDETNGAGFVGSSLILGVMLVVATLLM